MRDQTFPADAFPTSVIRGVFATAGMAVYTVYTVAEVGQHAPAVRRAETVTVCKCRSTLRLSLSGWAFPLRELTIELCCPDNDAVALESGPLAVRSAGPGVHIVRPAGRRA